jgi:hypothetical protein
MEVDSRHASAILLTEKNSRAHRILFWVGGTAGLDVLPLVGFQLRNFTP